MKEIKNIVLAVVAVALLHACAPAEGEFGGTEYMPDMAHSVAYEANTYNYYYYNTWDSASTFKLKELSNPRLPVKGTIPRGYAGAYLNNEASTMEAANLINRLRGGDGVNAMNVPVNGNVPYYYEDTEEERTRASLEIIANPYPITDAGLKRAKDLYDIYCGICHGEKGDGGGYLVREANPAKGDAGGVYPAAPANLLLDTFLVSSNGRFYHAIMHGKNVMGGYADKLSYEERWQVIHYIRSLQAKDKKLQYSEASNTLNPSFGIPASDIEQIAQNAIPGSSGGDEDGAADHEGNDQDGAEHHDGGNHDGDHDH